MLPLFYKIIAFCTDLQKLYCLKAPFILLYPFHMRKILGAVIHEASKKGKDRSNFINNNVIH